MMNNLYIRGHKTTVFSPQIGNNRSPRYEAVFCSKNPGLKPVWASFAGKRVLITGGMGFIGSNLAHALVRLKAKVLIIDSMFPLYGGNVFNIKGIEGKCKIVIKDIGEQAFINSLVKNQDFIFSLAGQVSHVDSLEKPFQDLKSNCLAQLSLLEACKKYNPKTKIVFAGTRGQYGKYTYLPVDENHPTKPIDINGINKMAAES